MCARGRLKTRNHNIDALNEKVVGTVLQEEFEDNEKLSVCLLSSRIHTACVYHVNLSFISHLLLFANR